MSEFEISTERDGNYLIATVSGTPEKPDGSISTRGGIMRVYTAKPSDAYTTDELADNIDKSGIPPSDKEPVTVKFNEKNEFEQRILVGEGEVAATAEVFVAGTGSSDDILLETDADAPNEQQFNQAVKAEAGEIPTDEAGVGDSIEVERTPAPRDSAIEAVAENEVQTIQNSRVKIGDVELKRVERIKGSLPFQTERNVSLSGKTYVPESDRTNWGLTIEAKVSYSEMQRILNLSNPVRVTTALKSDEVEFSNIQYERVSDMDTVTVNGVRQPLYRVQLQTEEKSDDAQTSAGNIASGSIDVDE